MSTQAITKLLTQHGERGYEYGPDDLMTVTCECGYKSASADYEAQSAHLAAEEVHARHQAGVIAKSVESRIVTTIDELDALGRAATILDSAEHVWTNDGDTLDQWGSVTRAEAYGGPMWSCSADIPLPATVLHEPAA